MKEDVAVSVLRIAALLTMFVGLILITMTVIGTIQIARMGSHVDGVLIYSLLSNASVLVWGWFLWHASPALAKWVAK